ncbi:MAG: hypothetical protein H7226_03350 [Salinibacterium sp.]|nr:hypothetical protein [Salinibacterium sp.]
MSKANFTVSITLIIAAFVLGLIGHSALVAVSAIVVGAVVMWYFFRRNPLR